MIKMPQAQAVVNEYGEHFCETHQKLVVHHVTKPADCWDCQRERGSLRGRS